MAEKNITPRVMIVEDNVLINQMYSSSLQSNGMDVVARALNGEAALAKLSSMEESRLPDVLILDLMLPKIDGMDVLEVVKKNYPGTYVLIASALDGNREMAMKLGADGFFTKPVLMKELVRNILELVEKGSPSITDR